jgi:carbamoyltransferase
VLAAVDIEKECCRSEEARCVIAYFIQSVCENALSEFIASYGVNNLVVAGGTFYNVKLNNRLLTETDGVFCAMPLAGDQGAAIGLYEAEDKKDAPAFSFDTLSWGKRRLYNFDKYTRDNVHYYRIQEDDDELAFVIAEEIATRISNGKLVNVVFGNMEFGPRALGNTSTLFLPTVKNTADNNHMNKRNEVMPCAPICTYSAASELFDEQELSRVIGSDRFMICTHNYKKPFSNQYGGVMHHKTMSDDTYTGRPQIVRPGTFIDMILRLVNETTDIKCLVNTSFNAHGNPIVFDTKDIIDNFNFQCEHAHPGHEPELFVVKLYE